MGDTTLGQEYLIVMLGIYPVSVILFTIISQDAIQGNRVIIKSCGQKDKKNISFGKILSKNLTK